MARFHLRLNTEEFYDNTPRQMQFLVRRFREQSRSLELLAGIIASEIRNLASSFSGGQMSTPSQFMPSEQQKQNNHPTPGQVDREYVARKTSSFFESMLANQQNKGIKDG